MGSSSRILEILHRLIDGGVVNIDDVANDTEVSKRSIQRDMSIIKEYFGDGLDNSIRGEYKLIGSSELKGFLDAKQELKEIKSLLELLVMIDSPLLRYITTEDYPFLNSIKKDANEIFHLCEPPFEEFLDDKNILRDLKKAIKNKQYINLVYSEPSSQDFTGVKPHRILFSMGNLYLVISIPNDEFNGGVRLLRVSFVKSVDVLKKTYHRDVEIDAFIEDIQTPFTSFKAEKYEVIAIASPSVARFFRNKKHLKSQKIVINDENDENGLKLRYEIRNSMEIIPLVKSWLPDLKIISPIELKEEIDTIVKSYFI